MNKFIVTIVLLVVIVAISILQVSMNTTLLKMTLTRTTTTAITATTEEEDAVVVVARNTTTNSSSGTMTTTASAITSDDGILPESTVNVMKNEPINVDNVVVGSNTMNTSTATSTKTKTKWPLFNITYPYGMSGGFIHLGKSGGSTISSTQLINHCHSIFKKNPNQWKQFCNCTDGIVTTTRNSISCNNTEYYKTKSTVGIMIEDYYHGKFKQNVAIKREEEEEEEE